MNQYEKSSVQDNNYPPRSTSRQYIQDAQVFHDPTGIRKGIVNFVLPLTLLIAVMMTVFVSSYVRQIVEVRGSVGSVEVPRLKNTGISMLYTDNAPHSTAVVGDQIVKLDTLFMPRFLYKDGGFTIPDNYQKWDDFAKGVGIYRPVHHKLQYIFSAKNYGLMPTERVNFTEQENQDNRNITLAIDVEKMQQLSEQVKKSKGDGLFIEVDLSVVDSAEAAEKLSGWLASFKSVLDKQQLSLGIIYQANEISDVTAPVLKSASAHYVTFNVGLTINEQIANLKKHEGQLASNITYELPTVSTSENLDPFKKYTASITYADSQKKLINQTFSERSVEPIAITSPSTRDNIRDAVSANNIIRSLDLNLLLRESTSYAVANPGFEEFTVWSLISRPADSEHAKKQLSSNVYSSLKVEREGSGYIQQLVRKQLPGTRTILMDEKGFITSSTLTQSETNALIKLSGQGDKKIALTFDDGPGPYGTQKVLDILDKHGVKGTFFMIGENVVANSAIASEVVARGHEVENHSYNHPKFNLISEESQVNQIVATSRIIEEITGAKVKYFRQPYSVDTAVETTINIDYLARLKSLGLEASEYDIDSKDWDSATVEESVKRVIDSIDESDGEFSQILFHDNHEKIDITLQALPIIISELKDRGIEMVRVDELAGAALSGPPAPVSTSALLAFDTKDKLVTWIVWANTILIALTLVKYCWVFSGMTLYSFKRGFRRLFIRKMRRKDPPVLLPHLTVIIACYNEELVIERTLQSLIDCEYPWLKIIVVNDGSKDKTAEVVGNFVAKHPSVELFNVPNGGKAQALKYGIAQAHSKWLVFCDADTIFDKNALHNFAYSTMSEKNLGAVAGKVIVGNDINFLTRAQVIEYGIAHMFFKSAQDSFNTVTVVPGAISLWNREALLSIGGFTPDTLAEDADATLRVIIKGKTVRYWSNVKAKTEAPLTIRMHYKQRTRWQLGNMQAIYKHRDALLNSRDGSLGVIGLPFFYVDMVAALVYPILFIFALIIMSVHVFEFEDLVPQNVGFIISPLFTAYSLSMFAVEILLAIGVIIAERKSILSKLGLLSTLPYYMIVYRFLLSYATLVAGLRALKGTLQGWGHLARTASVR